MKKRMSCVLIVICILFSLFVPTVVVSGEGAAGETALPKIELISKESLPWTDDGIGVHYMIRFKVTENTVRCIGVGDNLLTVNNESPILADRSCKITVDDGRTFMPDYSDYYAGWSESRKAISRGVTTCGVFIQSIPDGIIAGQVVTIEVRQRATTTEDILQPQLLCYAVEMFGPGTPCQLIYGSVVYNDRLGHEEYKDEPFYPSYKDSSIIGSFYDVLSSAYYAAAVEWAITGGIAFGTDPTSFSPDAVCTRAQTVTFIWRATGCPEPQTINNPFTDITADQYYYKAILWAVEKGIASGVTDTLFKPEELCTRAQAMTFLHRFMGSPTPLLSKSPFTDVLKEYYYIPVLWALENNVTAGTTETTFSPDDFCIRSQIVTFLYRLMK